MNNLPELKFDSTQAIRKTFLYLLAFDAFLVLGDILFNWNSLLGKGEIQLLFNITREDALATTYSSFQAIFAGLIGLLVALALKAKGERKRSYGWTLLGLFFIYIGVDDAAQIHERCGTAFKTYMTQNPETFGFLTNYASYSWHLLFGGFFGSVALFILIFLWKEYPTRRRQMIYLIALGCYVLAVGMDVIEGLMGGLDHVAELFDLKASLVRHSSKVIEEFIEMFGTTLFLVSFLIHYIHEAPGLIVKFTSRNTQI